MPLVIAEDSTLLREHVNAIFDKLGLTTSAAYSRRSLVIVRYLQG